MGVGWVRMGNVGGWCSRWLSRSIIAWKSMCLTGCVASSEEEVGEREDSSVRKIMLGATVWQAIRNDRGEIVEEEEEEEEFEEEEGKRSKGTEGQKRKIDEKSSADLSGIPRNWRPKGFTVEDK